MATVSQLRVVEDDYEGTISTLSVAGKVLVFICLIVLAEVVSTLLSGPNRSQQIGYLRFGERSSYRPDGFVQASGK